MPKVTDIKAYWRELAAKAGLGEDELKQVTAVLDNDKFAKAFTDGFKPLPDYSHDMNDVREKSRAEKDAEYNDWFKKEQLKFNEYVSVVDQHKKYKEVYGDLDGTLPVNDPANPNGGNRMTDTNNTKKYLTQEELETHLAATLSRRDAAVLDLLEVRESHMNTFKKSLDVKAFESAWKEHPEWGGSMKIAYEKYTQPEMEKAREAQTKSDSDRRYEEGVRDGWSRRAVPTDSSPKTFSPMFDRKEDVAKMNEGEQEKHSRSAFFEGLREKTTA